VPLQHAEYHGKPQSRAAFPLGGIERLEAAGARGLAHADTVVLHFDDYLLVARIRTGTQRDQAAVGERVHGIQHEIGERVAHLALRTQHLGKLVREIGLDAHHHAAFLRHVVPGHASQVDDLREYLVQIDRCQRAFQAARHVERAHALHGLRHILDGALDHGELLARTLAECRFVREQRLRVEVGGRRSVINVMCDATGDLPQARSRSCCITVCCVWRRSW
jgi:hypothetical protein